MAKRILLIDGQLFQTAAWDRGMGQYMLHLLEQANALRGNLKISIVLNSSMPIDPRRIEYLAQTCAGMEVLEWNLPLPPNGLVQNRDENRYIRAMDGYIKPFLDKGFEVSYLIAAPFMFDFFALFPSGVHKLIMAYDLTPLLHWGDLGGYFPPELYLRRFKQLLEADKSIAISETTASDFMEYLGLDSSRISNIDGGYTGFGEDASKPSVKLPAQYVLLPTADLPHKNNDVAVKGFYQFCVKTGWKGGLVVTSVFSDATKLWLKADSDKLVFTGNVPPEELNWLYQNAAAVLFPSKYEGLGIPLLDAVAYDKPAVTSRIPVFLEMTKTGYFYFEQDDPAGVARALESALLGNEFEIKRKVYPKIMQRYSWRRSAEKFIQTVNSTIVFEENPPKKSQMQKPKIAIVSEHPGLRVNMLAQLGERLYSRLSSRAKVDYYFDAGSYKPQQMERPTFLDQQDCEVFDVSRLTLSAYRQYEKVIYILERDSLGRTAQRAAVLPGMLLYAAESTVHEQAWNLVVDNQYASKQVSQVAKKQNLNELADWIFEDGANKKLDSRCAILRSRGSLRSIMKQLMELTNNDK